MNAKSMQAGFTLFVLCSAWCGAAVFACPWLWHAVLPPKTRPAVAR